MTMAAARKGVFALALSSSLHARSSSSASAFQFQQHQHNLFLRRVSSPLPTTSPSCVILRNKSTTSSSTKSAKTSDDPSLHNNDEDYEWLKQSRPLRIQARLLPPGEATATTTNTKNSILESSSSQSSVVTKIIHFQRHGQGTHNALYKQWTDKTGIPLDLSEMDPTKNPMVTDVILDAPLTQKGRDQCEAQKDYASKLENVELVIVSPLVRALQTAHITFGDYLPTTTTTTTTATEQQQLQRRDVKWIAHEGIREELGTLMCNKRQPFSETKSQFPLVDYTHLPQVEEDVLWNDHAIKTSDENGVPQRESMEDMSHRAYDFLTEFVYRRPEREIAVVGHSAWLLAMTGAVLDLEDGDDNGSLEVKSMFGQAELRSLELVFLER